MPRGAKIVFVGATSASYGLNVLRDLFSTPDLAGSTLVLVARNAQALQRMAELAALLNRRSGAGFTIEQTSDRRAALDGAAVVINATAVDRLRMWRLSFDVPRKYGIRHTLGENGGPGGLFSTLRTLPLVFDIVRDIERACPDALLVNFSNPESEIVLALGKYSKTRAVGLCHGLFMARDDVARILGVPASEVELWAEGINHFQWLIQIRNRVSGEDFYPMLREKEATYDASATPLSRRLFRAFGYWPTCSDEHLGEYLAYGWEAGEAGYDFDLDERRRADFRRTLDDVLSGAAPLPCDWLTASGERGATLIAAVLTGKKACIESGIVYNRRVIPNLPFDAAVEVPIVADAAGVHPVSLGPLPEPIAKLLSSRIAVQQLAVEAALRGSKEIALQALLIDPVVNSADAALRLLDDLWEANRPYIRASI